MGGHFIRIVGSMNTARPTRQTTLIDLLYVAALMLYVLAGMTAAPFHGDEPTIIHMGRDWYTLLHRGNFEAVGYTLSPASAQARDDQELRILNGVLSKYSIGLFLSIAGIPEDALPTGWAWGRDWWDNAYFGHIPRPHVLFASRLPSTLLTMLSVAVIFVIGRMVGGRGGAWFGSLVYATLPIVLLNGRRAMFEGALLITLALLLWAGLYAARRPTLRKWALVGLAAGLAMAAKHTNVMMVVAVVGGLLILHLRTRLWLQLRGAALAAVLAAGLFFALNPAWWSDPLRLPGVVLSARERLLQIQIAGYGAYESTEDRLAALARMPFGVPQYEEDAGYDWHDWIGKEIDAYDSSIIRGVAWPAWIALVAVIGGVVALVSRPNRPRLLLLIVLAASVATIFVLTPMAWQRYYLPLAAPLAVTIGCGLNGALRLIRRTIYQGKGE